jgi:hypothetical protein
MGRPAVIVFDLDMTIIDSSHRHASKPDGSIDLAHWFQNATPEKIAGDTLLPLAKSVKAMFDAGHHVVLCTARCMQKADWDFIAKHFDAIPHHALYSRPGHFVTPDSPEFADSYHGFVGDTAGDGELKIRQITEYVQSIGCKDFDDANVIIYEDNMKTLKLFLENGAIGINAIRANERLRKAA